MMSIDEDGKQLSVVHKRILEQQQLKARVEQAKKERAERARKNLSKTGRKKGAKGKATLLRQAVLAKAENMVLEDWPDVVETTLEMAKGGDTTALKILWDKVIPSQRAIDPNSSGADKLNITINVGGLEMQATVKSEPVIEDAEFTEINVESTDGDS